MGVKKYKNQNAGFLGLISLLIAVAVIAFLLVRSDLFISKDQKSFDEIRTGAMDDARDVKGQLEERDREVMQELDY